MDTKIKTDVFAKQLRARLAVLKKEHEAAKVAYDKGFDTWRQELASFVQKNGPRRILTLTKTDVKKHTYGDGFAVDKELFRGAPQPPKPPDDSAIRAVQKTLRFIGITGQKEMTLRREDVAKYFTDTVDDRDD